MTKEMDALFLKELNAENARNSKIFPSGIQYKSGSKESYFSKKNETKPSKKRI